MRAMATLKSSAPVLLVADVQAAAAFYRDTLGFRFDLFWGEPPNFCMAHRDDLIVMLTQVPRSHRVDTEWRTAEHAWSAYFWVDDAQSLHDEFVGKGAVIDAELCEKPYGILEFTVRDLDGHYIGFGQPV
jgi:catechol 2,3-dioxygenase-like lactoylglutathione lyase family enzyme